MAGIFQWLRFPWSRAVAVALTTVGIAACSGESSRFSENPFSGKNGPEATGSIQQAAAAPISRVESRPLPSQTGQPPTSPPATHSATVSPGVVGGGKGMASYTPVPSPVRSGASGVSEVTGANTQACPERQLELGRRHPHNGGLR
jgi:hypothetical protein